MQVRKILVPLSGQYDPADPESLELPALATAFDLGRRFGAHVEVFCVEALSSEGRRQMPRWVPRLAVDDLIDMIEKEDDNRRQRARALFKATAERYSAPERSEPVRGAGFSVDFVEVIGEVNQSFPSRGRLADLIVTACFPLERHFDVPTLLEVALRETGRPVLVAPPAARTLLGKKIAIAWNGSAEAARAVGQALQFLTMADEVVVICVNEDEAITPSADSLAEYLLWHGVRSRTVTLGGSAISAGGMLLEQVEKEGADMLIMGAYTRDRIRRVIFGGVTNEVLSQMPVPVLMID